MKRKIPKPIPVVQYEKMNREKSVAHILLLFMLKITTLLGDEIKLK